MSETPSVRTTIIKYLLTWAASFGLLAWWTSSHPEHNWIWCPAVALCLTGLALMYAVVKLGNKAGDYLQKTLTEEPSDGKDGPSD